MKLAKPKPDRPRTPRMAKRSRRGSLPLRVERLESRCLMAASIAVDAGVPNETLDQAVDLGDVSSGVGVLEHGSLGDGAAGSADVEWYRFMLDRSGRVSSEI